MSYLFHSNYPYFEALHLGRFIRHLTKCRLLLDAGSTPTRQLCHLAWSAGNIVFKDKLFDPSVSPEEFARRQAEESRLRSLSKEDRELELDELVTRLRSGELDRDDSEDLWRTPVEDRDRVEEFICQCHAMLTPLTGFVFPGDSLLEDTVVAYLAHASSKWKLRGIYGLMTAWDPMRMHHEGRPPYSISFASGFGDSLSEAVAEEEGENLPDEEVDDLLNRLSGPQEYRMKPRDFVIARTGILRAHKASLIPEAVCSDLIERLRDWER